MLIDVGLANIRVYERNHSNVCGNRNQDVVSLYSCAATFCAFRRFYPLNIAKVQSNVLVFKVSNPNENCPFVGVIFRPSS